MNQKVTTTRIREAAALPAWEANRGIIRLSPAESKALREENSAQTERLSLEASDVISSAECAVVI